MAILDAFKRRRKIKEKESVSSTDAPERRKEKEVKPKEELVKKIPTPGAESKKRVPRIGEAYRILKTPRITEKSTDLSRKNQYTFLIWQEVNKVEVKKAVENTYNVEVTDVKIINIPKKRRRLGRTLGWKKGYKKAIVKVKEGQKIEIFPK